MQYVITGVDNKIYRLYDTIGQCWKSSLLRNRKSGTYWECRRIVERGETAWFGAFGIRQCADGDIENFEKNRAEWEQIVKDAEAAEEAQYAEWLAERNKG